MLQTPKVAQKLPSTIGIGLTAVVSPRLKKPGADYSQFSNFRPVSNLFLISKTIEKVVAIQLTNRIMNYHLDVSICVLSLPFNGNCAG